MNIRYINEQQLELGEEGAVFNFSFDDPNAITLGEAQQSLQLKGPGEYEYSDVSFVLLESRELKIGNADVFKVLIDGVEVLLVSKSLAKFSSEIWEAIGNVHVLVIHTESTIDDLPKLINQLEPHVVLALGSKSGVDVAKLTGIEAAETAKKFKYAAKDFQLEEPVTKLQILG